MYIISLFILEGTNILAIKILQNIPPLWTPADNGLDFQNFAAQALCIVDTHKSVGFSLKCKVTAGI